MNRHLCVVTVDDDSEREKHLPMDSAQQRTIEHCLQVAAQRFHDDAEQISRVKAALQDGQSVPMWADGPSGIRAADMLAAEFHRYEGDARKLLALLEGEDEDDEEASG